MAIANWGPIFVVVYVNVWARIRGRKMYRYRQEILIFSGTVDRKKIKVIYFSEWTTPPAALNYLQIFCSVDWLIFVFAVFYLLSEFIDIPGSYLRCIEFIETNPSFRFDPFNECVWFGIVGEIWEVYKFICKASISRWVCIGESCHDDAFDCEGFISAQSVPENRFQFITLILGVFL